MTLSDLIAPVLTPTEEATLVETIQRGSSRSEEAWERLIASHHRAIHQAAGRSNTMEPEDAYATALEAFVQAVRNFDLDLGLRLSTLAYPAMSHAVYQAASADHTVQIPRGVVNRYLALMKKADGDFPAAYRMAQEGGYEITPFNMLAAHRAMSDHYDADDVLGGGSSTALVTGDALAGTKGTDLYRQREQTYTPDDGHEEISVEFIREMFTAVGEDQEKIIRLAYGFDDIATDNARVNAGFRTGEPLSDREVGVVLGRGRSTVQRYRERGLETMRAVVQARLDEAA